MGGKSCFRLSLHLNYFFQDHRSICRVFVSKEMNYIKDLKNHITHLFNIENFYLMCLNNFLPDEEDVRILQLDDTIVAVPISIPERDVNIREPQNSKGSCKKDEVKKKRKKRKVSNDEIIRTESEIERKKRNVSFDDIFGTESEIEQEMPSKKKKKKIEKKLKKAAAKSGFNPPVKSSPMLSVSDSPIDKDSAIAQCSSNSKNDSNEPSPDFVNKLQYFETLKDTPNTSNKPKIVVTPSEEDKCEHDIVINGSVDKAVIKQKLINVLQTDTFHFADVSQKITNNGSNETPETVEKPQATKPKKYSIRNNVTPFKPVTVLKSRTNIVKNIIKYNLSRNESEVISDQVIKEENNSQVENIQNVSDSQTCQNLPQNISNSQNLLNIPTKPESPKTTIPKTPIVNHNDNTLIFASPKVDDKNITVPSIGPSELDFQNSTLFQNTKKSNSIISTNDEDTACSHKNLTVPCVDNTEMFASDSMQSDNTAHSEMFVTKRKRTRVRKRKKKNVEEVPIVPPPVVYKPPKTQAAPISHIRFEDEGKAMNGEELPSNNMETECIEIEDEEIEEIKIENVSLCENSEVMIQDSESENQQSNDSSLLRMINSKDRISVFSSDVLSTSVSNDVIARCPLMDKILPRLDDVIVFKILKITSSYTPEVSSPITGKVSYYDNENGEVHFNILEGKHELVEPQGKFSVDISEEETPTNTNVFRWTELIEPRLLFP